MSLLEVKNLKVELSTLRGMVKAVRDIDFEVEQGETVAIVGESGCGKTMTCLSIMKLLDSVRGKMGEETSITFDGEEISKLTERKMSRIRGNKIGMVFQDPIKSLNPPEKIGNQIVDIILAHEKIIKKEAEVKAEKLIEKVGIGDAPRRMKQYPHELSGGMRQRVVIAMAIACRPQLLIADEPTTALDVTIQAEILELLQELQKEYKMSILIVTHNLGVVATIADRVVVMYGGKIMETGTTEEIFYEPRHPYTKALLETIPEAEERKKKLPVIPGTPPNLINPPKGCPFMARCPKRMNICGMSFPKKNERCYCYLYDERCKREFGSGLKDE